MSEDNGTITAPRIKILKVPVEGELWRGAVVIDLYTYPVPRPVPCLRAWAEFSFRDAHTGQAIMTCVRADIHAGPGDNGVYADLTLLTDEAGEPLTFGGLRSPGRFPELEPVERDGEWLAGVFRFGIANLPLGQGQS